MTNATIQKRLTKLEAEMKLLKMAIPRRDHSDDEKIWGEVMSIADKSRASRVSVGAKEKARKLPKWLEASLKEVKERKTSGPFETVEELMADLNKPGE